MDHKPVLSVSFSYEIIWKAEKKKSFPLMYCLLGTDNIKLFENLESEVVQMNS